MLLFCLPDTPFGVSPMFEHILSLLQNTRQNSHSWTAQCPAHDDKRNSLSLAISQNNTILIKCFAGCSPESITQAIGLSLKDLFHDQDPVASSHHSDKIKPSIDRTYDYTDEFGNLIYQNVRFIPKDFRLRKPAPNNKWSWNLNGTQRTIYKLPETLESIALERTIIIVESEKSVDRLISLGFSATATGGASSWKPEFSSFFIGANVIIIPDRDKAGDSYALTVASSLHGKANQVSILTLPLPWSEKNGRDVFDWLLDHSAQDLSDLIIQEVIPFNPAKQPNHQSNPKPTTTELPKSAADLWKMNFPAPRFIVPDIIPEGLTLLVGAPKLGKSFAVHEIAIALATGGKAFGSVQVQQGHVLYLALEDNLRRLQKRLKNLCLELQPKGLENLFYKVSSPRLHDGLLPIIEEWLFNQPKTVFIILDTLAKVRPPAGKGSIYQEDYAVLEGLKAIADKHQIGILVIHHTNKGEHEDYFNSVSGTTGLTGAADTTLLLTNTKRGNRAYLRGDGRDLEKPIDLALQRDPKPADGPSWAKLKNFSKAKQGPNYSNFSKNTDLLDLKNSLTSLD